MTWTAPRGRTPHPLREQGRALLNAGVSIADTARRLGVPYSTAYGCTLDRRQPRQVSS